MPGMQTPRPPTKVGVAPGTTTFVLSGPTMATATVIPCDEDLARVALQRRRLWPAGKYRTELPSIASMAPTDGWSLAPRQTGLGLVLAPYGDRSPEPSVEMVGSGKGPPATCRGCRPSLRSDYQRSTTFVGLGNAWRRLRRRIGLGGTDGADGAYRGVGPFVAPPMPIASDGPPIIPTDEQLSSRYGYTPVMSQWIPFQQGNWPAPWSPPGGPRPLAGPRLSLLGAAETAAASGTPLPPELRPLDPAASTLDELRHHNERMYMLGMISAAAVASTAMINVFRYTGERRERRRKHTKVAAEPTAMISGVRRRRRRR